MIYYTAILCSKQDINQVGCDGSPDEDKYLMTAELLQMLNKEEIHNDRAGAAACITEYMMGDYEASKVITADEYQQHPKQQQQPLHHGGTHMRIIYM